MMKIKKSLLSVCLSILFIAGSLFPSISSFAVGNTWSDSAKLAYFNNNFGKINSELNGVYFRIDDLKQDLDDYFEDHKSSYGNYTTLDDLIIDNLTITYQEGDSGNSDCSFSQLLRQLMRDWCNAYIDANSEYFFGYSVNTGLYSNWFDSTDQLNKFISFIDTYEDDYYVFFNPLYHYNNFALVPLNYFDSFLYQRTANSYPLYDCKVYKNGSIPQEDWWSIYSWSDSANNWVETTNTFHFFDGGYTPLLVHPGQISGLDTLNWAIHNVNSETYKIYKNLNSLQLGSQANPFYYVSGSYNTTISGSYNTTTNIIDNSITYDIINDYANDFYDDNGRYPNPQEITIYIEIYVPDPSPSPSPSPSPGPDPGPGGGDDDENNGNIWDFLERIGEILGNLIATLGEVVAGLISAISSIVTSLITSFPNVIGGLIEYFLPFLPEELITVISLSIILSIIVGIIKLIRG